VDSKRTEFLIFRAWKLRLVAGVLSFAMVATGWILYQLGTAQGSGHADNGGVAELRAERDRLRGRLSELEARNAELERQLVLVERSRQIDAEAYAVFNQEHSGLYDEILGLREELAFYRGILSPDEGKIGLQAQDFDVKPMEGLGSYRFSLVLTQAGGKEQVARGSVRLVLEGREDGVPRQLDLKELTPNGEADIAYRFRYFQNLAGDLQLPERFVPERVVFKAVPTSAPRLPLEWTFDWPREAISRAEEN
jgi:hypothetical protein